MPTRRGVLFLLAGTALAAVSCSRHEPAAQAHADGTRSSTRIVVLSPGAAVILRDLGMEQSIVGRHAYDLALDPSVPVCGDQNGIDYEALLKTRPTHVIIEWGSRTPPERLSELARHGGWNVHNISTLTLRDVRDAVDSIDRVVRGVQPDAPLHERAHGLHQRLTRMIDLHPQPESRERVLLLISTAPPGALGPGSCHHELLLHIGAAPALQKGGAFQELTHEDLVRIAPERMVLFLPRSPRAATESGMTPSDDPWRPLRGLKLPAIERGRTVILDDPLCLLPSTSLIETAETMREAMLGWDAVEGAR